MLIPVYKQSFGTSEMVEAPVTADQGFLVALARAFDKNAAKALNDKEGELWQTFVGVLRVCLTRGEPNAASGSIALTITFTDPQYSLNAVFEETLRGGLFIKLSFERQVELCQLLLDLGGVAKAVRRCVSYRCTWIDVGIDYTMQKDAQPGSRGSNLAVTPPSNPTTRRE